MTYLRNAASFLVVLFSFTAALSADTVQLDTGDSVQGTVLQMKDGKLSVCTAGFGEVEACWTSVVSLSTDDELMVTYADGSYVIGRLQLDTSGVLTVTDAEGTVSESTAGAVCSIGTPVDPCEPCNPCDPCNRKVDHCIKVLGTLSDYEGNNDTGQVELEGEWKRTVKVCGETKSELFAKGEYKFVETTGKTNVSRGESELSYKHFFRKCDYWRLGQEFEHDRGRNLELRSQTISGLGHYWIRNKCVEFYTEGGLIYTYRFYRADKNGNKRSDEGHADMLLGFGGVYHITKKLKATHKFEYMPEWENFGDYLIEAETKLIYCIDSHWELTGQHQLDYKSEPEGDDKKHADHVFKVKIGYKF